MTDKGKCDRLCKSMTKSEIRKLSGEGSVVWWAAGTKKWMGHQLGNGTGHCSVGVAIIRVEPVPRHTGADLDRHGTRRSL